MTSPPPHTRANHALCQLTTPAYLKLANEQRHHPDHNHAAPDDQTLDRWEQMERHKEGEGGGGGGGVV